MTPQEALEYLEGLLFENKWSQHRLAKEVGLSYSLISHLLTRRKEPTKRTIRLLSWHKRNLTKEL